MALSSPVLESSAKESDEVQLGPRYMFLPDINAHWHFEDVNKANNEPRFTAEHDVKFFLYTRENLDSPDEIMINEQMIRDSHYSSKRNTRFLIHGWNNNGGSSFNIGVKNALLGAVDCNVIVVDWGKGAQTINYIAAR